MYYTVRGGTLRRGAQDSLAVLRGGCGSLLGHADAREGAQVNLDEVVLGWHYLSNATYLMRPHLFSTALLA